MFCPARWAAGIFRRHNVSAYRYQFKHPALALTCAVDTCNAVPTTFKNPCTTDILLHNVLINCAQVGAPHSSDVAFWFGFEGASLRSYEELQLSSKMSGYLRGLAGTIATHHHIRCVRI